MHNNILLPQGFQPKGSMQLGRFLVDVNQPHVSQHDPEIHIQTETDILVSQLRNFGGQQQGSSGISFGAGLPSLLSVSIKDKMNASTVVSAESVTSYQLINSGSFFRQAVKNLATRKWLEQQYDEGWSEIVFVVGYYVMEDAVVLLGSQQGRHISGQAQIPLSQALAAGGIPLPPGGITDPKFSADYQNSSSSEVYFVAQGERVCAFQYRKIVFSWFSSRKISQATLSRENRWHTVSETQQWKGGKDEDEGDDEEDVVEVNLEDEVGNEDSAAGVGSED